MGGNPIRKLAEVYTVYGALKGKMAIKIPELIRPQRKVLPALDEFANEFNNAVFGKRSGGYRAERF